MKSCPCGRLTLVPRTWQKVFLIDNGAPGDCSQKVCFAAISHCNCSPSCSSSLGLPFQEKVQEVCIAA
eukprot:2612935-Ditylum_brightwellii.AAC.1